MKQLMLILLLVCAVHLVHAQPQLVLLKRGDVVARFQVGDQVKCKLRNNKVKAGMAIRFTDVSILLRGDTIPFAAIDKFYVKNKRKPDLRYKFGTILMIGGVGYFAIDQVNTLFFVEGQQGIDAGVSITSASMVTAGAALRFLRSPYLKTRGLSIRTIYPDSRYYRYE
ncbi:MAG: hypothetical protein KF775_16400 [Cyclobacteriaceae bacterium]|nr:hypothetical protein [Cyclobacteriaceae bacterium]